VMMALRTLGPVTRVVIAHVSKAAADSQSPARPYGSVFYNNLARSVWEVKRSGDDTGADLHVLLSHTKVNGERRQPAIPLRFTFEPDRVTLHAAQLADVPDLAVRASMGQRIRDALSVSALTVDDLADHLGAKPDSVRRTVERMRRDRVLVNLPSGAGPLKWALASARVD
jgi:hypothetical protein